MRVGLKLQLSRHISYRGPLFHHAKAFYLIFQCLPGTRILYPRESPESPKFFKPQKSSPEEGQQATWEISLMEKENGPICWLSNHPISKPGTKLIKPPASWCTLKTEAPPIVWFPFFCFKSTFLLVQFGPLCLWDYCQLLPTDPHSVPFCA